MPASGRRRAYGQHFLNDSNLCKEIVQKTCELREEFSAPAILEIGPGQGAITDFLIEANDSQNNWQLKIIEKDQKLGATWEDKTKEKERISVRTEDFLTVPTQDWSTHTPLIVVSNLPYSVGTAIVDRLSRQAMTIPAMVLMFQKEVAKRLYATPGTKSWGSLSAWMQNIWDIEPLWHVPPSSFTPPPDVDSEVILMRRRATFRIKTQEAPWADTNWENLLKAAFKQRRKMLRASLGKMPQWKPILERSQIDSSKRAEALSWEEWQRLYDATI